MALVRSFLTTFSQVSACGPISSRSDGLDLQSGGFEGGAVAGEAVLREDLGRPSFL